MENLMLKPVNCKCGSPARIRYKIPVTWVECKKKCGMKTGFYFDKDGVRDTSAEEAAVKAWNRMVFKDG